MTRSLRGCWSCLFCAGLICSSLACASRSDGTRRAAERAAALRGPDNAAAYSPAINIPGVQRTAAAVEGLRTMVDELGRVRQTVGDTLNALQELSSARGDLLGPFEHFIRLNEEVDHADRQLAEQGDSMRALARDYITNWEVEVYGVEDPELRTQAESRRNRVRADYGRIAEATRALRNSMDPFRRQLDDLQSFLANDLTPAGVRAAAPAIERARENGGRLQQRIDGLIAEVERVAQSMTPAGAEPSPGSDVRPGDDQPRRPTGVAPPPEQQSQQQDRPEPQQRQPQPQADDANK